MNGWEAAIVLPTHHVVRSDMSESEALGEAVSDLTISVEFWSVEKIVNSDLVRIILNQ